MNRRETGALGERIACDFLGRNGYDIIETNYRCPEGEIDIITRQGNCLVFVEVRTRVSLQYGTPAESVTRVKQGRLAALAGRYLQEHEDLPEDWRIDVIAIQMDHRGCVARIELIENCVDGGF